MFSIGTRGPRGESAPCSWSIRKECGFRTGRIPLLSRGIGVPISFGADRQFGRPTALLGQEGGHFATKEQDGGWSFSEATSGGPPRGAAKDASRHFLNALAPLRF